MEPRIDFEKVAAGALQAMFRALTDRSPKAVYPAGKGSRFLRLLPGVLSDRALDCVRLKLFPLPSRFGALTQERTHA
jgi:hypothetical protein